MTSRSESDRPVPRSSFELFIAFTLLALQGFGGVLAVVQRELVERRRWLTQEEFVEDWAVAQIMPGPNVVNISVMIGVRHFGVRGALAAVAGMLVLPLALLLLLALVYARYADHSAVVGALRGMSAVAAGLIAATGLKLIGALRKNILGLKACTVIVVVSFIAIALMHVPLAAILLCVGVPACILAYRRLRA